MLLPFCMQLKSRRFVMPLEWRPELEALATELDFLLTVASAMEQRFFEVIQMLAQSAKADA